MNVQESVPVENFKGFIFCKSLGYKEETIKKAYKANNSKIYSFLCTIIINFTALEKQ